MDLMDMND